MTKIYQLSLIFLLFVISGCEVVGTIFKGGMWFGVIIVVAVILLIVYLLKRSRK